AGVCCWQSTRANPPQPSLPRFTEVREAAALHFVKKNLPELLTVLEQLKKDSISRYKMEIREIFQVTEILADMADDQARHDLEWRIWVTENRAHLVAARLTTPSEDERQKILVQLQDLAKQLITLEVESLELKVDQLEKELGDTREELTKVRENRDKLIK